MKIEHNFQNPGAAPAQRAEGSRKAGGAGDGGSNGTVSDRIRVSPDASLLSQVLRSATEGADVRSDVVERARKALAAGDLGTDAARLADRIIDHLLES